MKLFNMFRKRTRRDIDRSPHNPADPQLRYQQNLSPGAPGEDFIPVVSSWLAGMRWEPDDRGSVTGFLQIRKRPEHGGGTMTYAGVPEAVYDDFFAAGSKGEFFNKYIRDAYVYLGES